MNSYRSSPAWEPLTAIPKPAGYRLERALITTFDPPDAGALIEDYLPTWLGLENEYTNEGTDRLRYFAELEDELRRLKGRFAIISTPGESGPNADGWIWSYIRRLEVGADRRAVQHAKLWMFHRVGSVDGNARDILDLVVSSANLTRAGLNNQIQAGWRCSVALETAGSHARLSAWGVLPGFLVALGAAAGDAGRKAVAPWSDVLSRARAPEDASFIASVPGNHHASTLRRPATSWGATGLARVWRTNHRRLTVLVPTIGSWNTASLRAWFNEIDVLPARVAIAWIPPCHPWASEWQLDAKSERALTGTGLRWLRIPGGSNTARWESPLCKEHLESDLRWSHAKLYDLRDGHRRLLLITSANFSRAAWGDAKNGELNIENFELGVVIPIRGSFADALPPLPRPRHTCDVDFSPVELPIAWASAEWNGTRISIDCRPRNDSTIRATVEVRAARTDSPKVVNVTWRGTQQRSAQIGWSQTQTIPLVIRVFTEAGDARDIAIADVRPEAAHEYVCNEFDEDKLREAADALLEERYGFIANSDDPASRPNGDTGTTPTSSRAAYEVPAYQDARRRFALIDNWAKALDDATEGGHRWVLSDGERIAKRWEAHANAQDRSEGLRIAVRIAAEELRSRIRTVR